MLKQKEEEIKKLIKSGFDLELISFELDIPIEQVRKYKIDVENSKVNYKPITTYRARKVINEDNNPENVKINQMREKYSQLYYNTNRVEAIKPKALSQEEIGLINTVILVIEEKINKMKNLSIEERISIANSIISDVKKIEKYQLPMEQAEKLYSLMSSQELYGLKTKFSKKVDYNINKKRRICANKYAKAIELEQYNIYDIDELRVLERKITWKMEKEDPIYFGTLKTRISNKRMDMQQQQAIARIRNDIPTSIISIIQSLADGNVDIQKANAIIDEEARKRVESKPKTRFSLTEEQERKQILTQIRTAITEKADRFYIQDPESTVLQLQQLCGEEITLSVRAVVINLIGQKDFETAKKFCNKFSARIKDENGESEYTKYIRGITNEIRNAEIGNVVMQAIKMNGTPKEEWKYFSLIEKGLKMGNVNLRAISLGKSKDGLKSITLADIWPDEIQKDR